MAIFLPGAGVMSPAAYGGASFMPTQIADFAAWFDASDGATITQSGGSVSQWNDKSGNGYRLKQATGTKQPTVQTAAQGGLDTLRFTLANSQVMGLYNSSDVAASIDLSGGYTVVAVVRRGGPSGANSVQLFSESGGTNYVFEWYSNDVIYSSNNGKYIYTYPTSPSSTSYALVTVQNDNTGINGLIRVDGTGYALDSNASGGGASNLVAQFGYADGSYMNGEVAEVCLYSSVLSSGDYQQVENYLKLKWATP